MNTSQRIQQLKNEIKILSQEINLEEIQYIQYENEFEINENRKNLISNYINKMKNEIQILKEYEIRMKNIVNSKKNENIKDEYVTITNLDGTIGLQSITQQKMRNTLQYIQQQIKIKNKENINADSFINLPNLTSVLSLSPQILISTLTECTAQHTKMIKDASSNVNLQSIAETLKKKYESTNTPLKSMSELVESLRDEHIEKFLLTEKLLNENEKYKMELENCTEKLHQVSYFI